MVLRTNARAKTPAGEAEHAVDHAVSVVSLDGMEHDDGDDRAERVDGRSLIAQDPGQALARLRSREHGSHNGRAGHDQDRAEHDHDLGRKAEEQPAEQRGAEPGDRDAQSAESPGEAPFIAFDVLFHEIDPPSNKMIATARLTSGRRPRRRSIRIHGVVSAPRQPDRQQQVIAGRDRIWPR